MASKKYHLHLSAILLFAICHFQFVGGKGNISRLFYPGCITSGNQTVTTGNLPATITATAAAGGNCNGSFVYQWQSSTDGKFYSDIAGATGQNLIFAAGSATGAAGTVTWYQRRATCGSEVKYTGFVTVAWTSVVTYYNVAKSGAYTRSNCPTGYIGSTVTYTVAAGKYSSTVSQADADQKAQSEVTANGQAYSDTTGTCSVANVAITVNNWTNENFSAKYFNVSTGITYSFTLPPNVNNFTVTQIPRATYNVTITSQSTTATYEWSFSNPSYNLAFGNSYSRTGMVLNCDCGFIEISYY